MCSLPTTTSSHYVSHKPFSYCTHTVFHFSPRALQYYPLQKTILKQFNVCDYHRLIWLYEQTHNFTGVLTVVIDVMCTRCVVHAHLDTFTAHHCSSLNKKKEVLQNIHKKNCLTLLELQKTARLTLLTYWTAFNLILLH
jgi:hypothetical protein